MLTFIAAKLNWFTVFIIFMNISLILKHWYRKEDQNKETFTYKLFNSVRCTQCICLVKQSFNVLHPRT